MTDSPVSLPDLLLPRIDALGARTCQRYPSGETRATRSFAELAAGVRGVARGLVARGVRPGDRVGIVSENGPRWLEADLGILTAGAIGVPRGAQSPPGEVREILGHAGCRVILFEDAATWERFQDAVPDADLVVVLSGPSPSGAVLTLDELSAQAPPDVQLPRCGPGDVATLVYTSGTTGRPKGVTLTHGNIVSNVLALRDVLAIEQGHRFLALLPSWHMYERTVEYYALLRGAEISYTDPRRLRKDLVEERPHYLASVPRVWERLHDTVVGGIRDLDGLRRRVATTALAGSLRYRACRNELAGRTRAAVESAPPPLRRLRCWTGLALWPLHAVAGRLVHGRLRRATGGRLRAAISGGGALPEHVDAFFDATGIPVLVGYGLTETSPVVAVRRPERNVLHTIGTAVRDTELDLRPIDPGARPPAPGEAGRLFVRGPQVMRGYWEDAEATAAVLDEEGWFDTGDLIRLTPAGDLVFCGRAKDTIVLRGGENVEPEPLEQAARAAPLIEQVIVLGQDRKALGALVWPAQDEVERRLGRAASPDAVLEAVRAELRARVGTEGGFRPWERIPHVGLLPEPLTVENGLLTATMKVKRRDVAERFDAAIRALFD